MYDICHPTYYNMSQLGCNDQVKLTTAFYVYMELCEVKRYWDVEYKYSQPLELFYLGARKSKNAKLETFIPWPTFHNLTLDLISNIQQVLNKEKFTFVFKEGDTTSVYYSICSGIIRPTSIEESNLLKQKEAKKFALEREIRRNTSNLYDRALSLNVQSYESNNDVKKDNSDIEEYFTPMSFSKNTQIENSNNSNDLHIEFARSQQDDNENLECESVN